MEENENNKNVSRRRFFKITTWGIGGAMSFLLGYPMVDMVVSKSKSGHSIPPYNKLVAVDAIPDSFKPVKKPSKYWFTKTDTDAYLKFQKHEDVWVVKQPDNSLKVFSPICPHMGCRYNWNQDEELFICPCHNSVYTIEGKVVSGPAPRGLDTLPIKIKERELYVLYERFEVGVPQKILIGY